MAALRTPAATAPSSLPANTGVPVAFNTNTVTNAVNRTYAVPTYMALESSNGFSNASVGYAGSASDGLTMLDSTHKLTQYGSAPDGHVTLTAEVPTGWNNSVTLALGFGKTQQAALDTAHTSVSQDFGRAWLDYERQWYGYDAELRKPHSLGAAAIREYYESVNVVKASEDKTFPGAIAAGLASPWGQSVPAGNFTNGEPTYFGSYREEFSRDTYEAFTGLLVAGDIQTARAATLFLFDRQQLPDGSMPRNSLPNGESAPDTGGLQLDECSYPILMDWQSGLAGDRQLYLKHVIPAADFVVAHGPSDGSERWEEQSGYSPSTIAAEIAGLTAAAAIARVQGDIAHARLYQATADDFARNIKSWTVTSTGPFAPRYFIRVSKTGDPNAAISYSLGNGSGTYDQRSVVDAGFLELVRLGVLPASDPDVQASVKVIDDTIERQTPNGPGWYRYGTTSTESVDGYGDCYQPSGTSCSVIGAPWPPTDIGTGHLWPVLSAERGEYDIANTDSSEAQSLLTAMRNMTSGQGLEPEQVWEDPNVDPSPFGTDPSTASIGFMNGQPAGSASPLTWAQASYARLALDLSAGRNLETPDIVTDRYVTHGMPGQLPLTVTSPASGATVTTPTVTVTGTTTPGAHVVAESVGPLGGTAGIASVKAGQVRRLDPGSPDVLRQYHDHGYGHAASQHRVHAAVRHRWAASGNHRAERRRSNRRRQRTGHLPVPDLDRLHGRIVRPDSFRGQSGRDECVHRDEPPNARLNVRVHVRRPAARHLRACAGRRVYIDRVRLSRQHELHDRVPMERAARSARFRVTGLGRRCRRLARHCAVRY